MSGQLFTRYFLDEGIKTTAEWQASVADPAAFAAFREGVSQAYEGLKNSHSPNEAATEQDLIRPVLELLGWTDYLPQQGAARNEDIPDHLLFPDADSKQRAAAEPKAEERFRYATVVEESKRFGLPLEVRDQDDRVKSGAPHSQILRYLSTAEIASDGRLRWGILTNGSVWRLYDHRARPRSSGYFEADLGELLQPGNEDDLRTFYLLFRRDSFVLQSGEKTSFLETALAEGRRYEERVAQDLSGVVFDRVFPNLVQALADASGADLSEVRQAALIFLYRLLFVLYAEDRGLLPVNDSRYDDYGLRKRVRDDIARRMADGDIFSTGATNYYDQVMTLFKLIDKGDPSIGLPPYNGGLFSSEAAPLLEQVRLDDATVAPLVDDLSHSTDPQGVRHFVNYRDMSVQQLGSLYERLLEREPVRTETGEIVIRPNPYVRKDSGSFFTPQGLVDLIVDRTLKPLVEERIQAFEARAAELENDPRPEVERRAELLELDPAEAVLNLKVLDPAMGSGHFLVTAVDFLSDYVAGLIAHTPVAPEWLDGEYASPLVERIATIRQEILQRAQGSGWTIDEAQLSDQAIIRRLVLKRCIYGVDKNPLTVELAKVSLWLHSFTVGAPLSFLDHHLRCGDALLGLRVWAGLKDLEQLSSMFTLSAIAEAKTATKDMHRIEGLSDAAVTEVQESEALFREVEKKTKDLRGLLDFLCGYRWLTAGMKQRERSKLEAPLAETLARHSADAFELLAKGPGAISGTDDEAWLRFAELWRETEEIAEREGFLHWEVAFPGVWHDWDSTQPQGGFDAIIGNPPWDRIKLQEVEWFATRDPDLARAPTTAARRKGIQQLRNQGAALAKEFDEAKAQSENLSRMVRSYGDYPLLSRGDINLYSLFVERAMGLIKPDGFVGLLTPSGIYGDKTAADFFKSVSTTGRVAGLFDFENRRLGTDLSPFFPDVDSRLKFCALILGGEERQFDQTECAFFLHDPETINNPDRCFPLAPADFARVNPNTGTAPIFRTRRDAEITRRIYQQHPALVDRSGGRERKTWPVKYVRMFDMTNDSYLFRTAAELKAEGFYPVQGNRWKRGEELYLPLYQGRMIHQFDHRANSVRSNPESTHNPYLSEEVGEAQHADPRFLPLSQYWVPAHNVEEALHQGRGYALGFRGIARSTDARTVVAAAIPQVGCGNSLPVLVEESLSGRNAACLLANLSSFGLDYVARQKVQGANLNWYIVEQLPVIAPADYDRKFGTMTAGELVCDHVLRLTYTAQDMAPFARDLGYDGPPFVWDEEERRHLRARLDALYFHLYGLTRDEAGYVLDTFPIIQREDEARFGHYRTRELILAYMDALAAGDWETTIEL